MILHFIPFSNYSNFYRNLFSFDWWHTHKKRIWIFIKTNLYSCINRLGLIFAINTTIERSHSQFSLLINRIEIIYPSSPREENEIFILFPSSQDGYQWWSNWIIVISCGQLQKWVVKKKKNIIVKQVTYIVADMARPRILPSRHQTRPDFYIQSQTRARFLLQLFLWFIDEFHKPVYLSILRTNSYLFLFTSGSFHPIKHFSF